MKQKGDSQQGGQSSQHSFTEWEGGVQISYRALWLSEYSICNEDEEWMFALISNSSCLLILQVVSSPVSSLACLAQGRWGFWSWVWTVQEKQPYCTGCRLERWSLPSPVCIVCFALPHLWNVCLPSHLHSVNLPFHHSDMRTTYSCTVIVVDYKWPAPVNTFKSWANTCN